MQTDKRIENEITHGKFIAEKGEEIWNWSSPAGKRRWQRRCKMFSDFIGNNNKRIFEVGCGTGLFTQELAKTNNQIYAIDVSQELLERAKQRVTNNNVTFFLENGYETSFEDNFFDFVVGSSVLHHLDVDRALKEFYRLLKKGGKLMFTEPNMLNPQIAVEKNVTPLKKWLGNSPDETAFFRWAITSKLLEFGFSNVSAVPFDFLHPAIPGFIAGTAERYLKLLERIPLVREIAGSLIITAEK